MSPPINLDGDTVDAITIDGDSVKEVTVDGSTVFSALPDSGVVDSFEDTNLSEYGGDTTEATFSSTDVKDGTQKLLLNTTAGRSTIGSLSGLETYPQQGQRMEVWMNPKNQDSSCYFGRQTETDRDDGFSVDITPQRSPSFRIGRDYWANNTLASDNPSLNGDQWYRVEWEWTTNNEIVARLHDSDGTTQIGNEISATDPTYTSGGIGFNANNNSATVDMEFDGYRIIGAL